MSYYFYNDYKIYYEEYGEGEPLILLHGNTSCGKMFDPIIPKLAKEFNVIVPDFLGCGNKTCFGNW